MYKSNDWEWTKIIKSKHQKIIVFYEKNIDYSFSQCAFFFPSG